ncbi:putative Thymus-specific serine protease [Paratrimastix pyriformis]|uniref:Thymus-specific serine protease n=1 Tax=Paratrimastix pyriformis TaxID=342808 RepID=A0ABQ8UP29_9EUKA|nr:putative Thymus-specific serine protease [Paratrimastix pyriformis]
MRSAVALLFLGLACLVAARKHENALNHILRRQFGDSANALDGSEQWFTQQLDHYDPFNAKTWQQLYFVNADNYRPGGPVFMHIGGEGPISSHYVYNMSFIPLAQKYGALVLALEHRYYGRSHPTPDMSTENMKWLSSQQALADLANFQMAMSKQFKLPAGTRWVTVGGSYPGCLSAFARIKYPHLFYASTSVSAPVRAKLDFLEYNEVVAASLGDQCTAAVRNATAQIDAMLNNADGRAWLYKTIPTCTLPISYEDTQVFFDSLSGLINGVVQYNGEQSGVSTITTICQTMLQPNSDPLTQLLAVLRQLMKEEGASCMDANLNTMLAQLSSSDWAVGGDMRAWTAQTCNEFGFYQTTTSAKTPYATGRLTLDYSLLQCQQGFGKMYANPPPVDWTNQYYGSDHPDEARIVFSNGSIDPWHALGVTSDLSQEMPAVYIKGTAHCADMSQPHPTDSAELVAGRQKVLDTLDAWLSHK